MFLNLNLEKSYVVNDKLEQKNVQLKLIFKFRASFYHGVNLNFKNIDFFKAIKILI